MKNYYCEKCGSMDVFIDDRGTQKALMCGDCGKWIKWISKKEIPLVERFIDSNKDINGIVEINKFKYDLNESIQKLNLSKDEVIEIIESLFK